MHLVLKNLELLGFKSYTDAQLEFCEEVNCFFGLNGSGKTNLLDAIYYLSFCKSFLNPVDSQNIKHGEELMMIQGDFDANGQHEHIVVGMKRNQKKAIKRNKKEYPKIQDHIGLLPLVMISPADTNLISEGSELRRKFIDGVISQYNKAYLDDLLGYNKALAQRNALLKQFASGMPFDAALLELWDLQLADYGSRIFAMRSTFLQNFIPVFKKYYSYLSSNNDFVELEYKSSLFEGDLMDQLAASVQKDRALQYTSVGIHKDDLEFLLEQFPLKRFGSQGQQKSFLVALKLAQYDFIRDKKQLKPLLLLDDIFDKLDDERVARLMQLVSDHNFGQLFVTDTNLERMQRVFQPIDTAVSYFEVERGKVKLWQE